MKVRAIFPHGLLVQVLAARDAALEKKEGVAAALQAELAGRDAQLSAAVEEAAALRQQVCHARIIPCWLHLIAQPLSQQTSQSPQSTHLSISFTCLQLAAAEARISELASGSAAAETAAVESQTSLVTLQVGCLLCCACCTGRDGAGAQ